MDVGIAIGVLGILITILIAFVHSRTPAIDVYCALASTEEPSIICCTVKNTGSAEAKDIYVGFNNMLLLETTLFSKPELGMELLESNQLPDPNLYPTSSILTKAFSVFIPRVPARSEVEFQIKSLNADNLRAARQVLRIRKEIEEVLTSFGEQLSVDFAHEYSKWDGPSVIEGRRKEECFFTPGEFSYSKGSNPVQFLSETEKHASAVHGDLYRRFKPKYQAIFETGRSFKAPVLRIRTPQGESTYGAFPPYVNTYVEVAVSTQELKEKGSMFVTPPVPSSYES